MIEPLLTKQADSLFKKGRNESGICEDILWIFVVARDKVDVDLEIEQVRRLRNIEQLRLLLFAEILLVMGMKSGICGDIL